MSMEINNHYSRTKVAAIQMCSSPVVDENLEVASTFIREAAQSGAKLIALPEMFAIMGRGAEEKVTVKEKFGGGRIQHFLSKQAQENQVWIVGGTIPLDSGEAGRVRAAALVFDDKGVCRARYDKIHLFDVVLSESEQYKESTATAPGHALVVLETPFGKLGLAVCYDLRFPEMFRCLSNEGADIIVLSAAFTEKTGKAHWEVLARSRAIENFCYFIGACQGGQHPNGRKTYGDSLIIDPLGGIMVRKDKIEPGVIYATIDLEKVYQARISMPTHHHQRIFFDTSKL